MPNKTYGKFSTDKCSSREFTFVFHREFNSRCNADCIYFSIYQEGVCEVIERPFSYILKVMDNGIDLKVIDLCANKYAGCGISRYIILRSKELFGKRIISSSNRFPSFLGESNWEDAINKVWIPLVKEGNAIYDHEFDYYYLL
jgi:hypothetical protein